MSKPSGPAVFRLAAIAAVATAVAVLLWMVARFLWPQIDSIVVHCTRTGCTIRSDLAGLLDQQGGFLPSGTMDRAQMQDRLAQWIARPTPRLLIGLAGALQDIPMTCLLVSCAVAFKALSRNGIFDARARRWMHYATWSALALVICDPLGKSLQTSLILDELTGGTVWRFQTQGQTLLFEITMCAFLWILTRATTLGSTQQDELASYV